MIAIRVLGADVVSSFGEGEGGFSGWSRCKERLDCKLPKKMAAWTVHDLRRSFVTGAAELGTEPHVIETIVNHISGHKGGVAGVYNLATYETEKRTALERWASHIARITGAKLAA